MTKPNWCKWVLMPEVKVWEACVLSIGLEPKTMEFERESWMYAEGTGPHITSESFPSRESEQKYKDLVDVLAANLLVREHFSPAAVTTRGKGYCGVRLDEFVRWATLKVKWLDLPPELAALAIDESDNNSPDVNEDSHSNLKRARDISDSANEYEYLATTDSIVKAFGQYGVTKEKIDNGSYKYIQDAKKLLGQGGKGKALQPMFCPHTLMLGMIKNKKATLPLTEKRGWQILKEKFPVAYARVEAQDPNCWTD